MLSAILFLYSCSGTSDENEKPNVSTELDKTMEWYQDAKFGMFIHWGLYSIPGQSGWFRYNENIPTKEIRIVNKGFLIFDEDKGLVKMKDTKRAWLNGWCIQFYNQAN